MEFQEVCHNGTADRIEKPRNMKNHKNLLKDFVSLSRSLITTDNSNKSVACSASLNLPQHSSLKIGPRRTLGLELMAIRDHFRKWSELMTGFDSNTRWSLFRRVLVRLVFGLTENHYQQFCKSYLFLLKESSQGVPLMLICFIVTLFLLI